MKSLGILTAATVLIWLVVALPMRFAQGDQAVLGTACAMLICLMPAQATLAWANRLGSTPDQQIVAVLAGTGVRLFVVLSCGLLLRWGWPERFSDSFLLWLGFFYLATLTLETLLILRRKSPAAD